MKKPTVTLSVLALASIATAAPVKIPVSADTWVGAIEAERNAPNPTSEVLRIALSGNTRADQYNRRAVFGFDISAIDPQKARSVTFTTTTSSNIEASYSNGVTLRAYLVSNAIADRFSQATATENSLIAAGFFTAGDVLDNCVTGTTIGEYRASGSVIGKSIQFNFSAEALADFKTDSNRFVTIIVESRTGNNAGYNLNSDITGFAFQSREASGGNAAELIVEEEASSVLISVGGFDVCLKK